VKVLDLDRQYELNKGNGITKNLAAPIRLCTSANKNVANWHEVALKSVSCRYRHMLEFREMNGLILRQDRLLQAIWCTKHNRLLDIYSQLRNRGCWTNGRKVGKSLKQEGFHTPSFPWSLLDHDLRNGGRRENL
jgi:hypothetical protein